MKHYLVSFYRNAPDINLFKGLNAAYCNSCEPVEIHIAITFGPGMGWPQDRRESLGDSDHMVIILHGSLEGLETERKSRRFCEYLQEDTTS